MRVRLWVGTIVVIAVACGALAVAALLAWPKTELRPADAALAHIVVPGYAGRIASVTVTDPPLAWQTAAATLPEIRSTFPSSGSANVRPIPVSKSLAGGVELPGDEPLALSQHDALLVPEIPTHPFTRNSPLDVGLMVATVFVLPLAMVPGEVTGT